MARPVKEFDSNVFEALCGIMCTEEEICEVFGTTDKTLSAWCVRTYGEGFSESQKRFSARGKTSLRRYQFNLAKKSPAMAIFLGKQYLGQRDMVEYEDKESIARLDAILGGMKYAAQTQPEAE